MNVILPFGESDAYVGRVLPGGLRVLEWLGNTGDGPLYRAQYPEGPQVALTLLDALARPRDPSAVSPPSPRLAHQLRRACQIRHPNVAGLVEVGETSDGITYAVGELLTGELLSHVLAVRDAFPVQEAVDICLQAAAGLQAAHRIGIVHGDLSPRTILIAQSEGDRPSVKLIRFKLDWDAETGRGTGGGPDDRYSSPERLAGSTPDELSDVFSLGAVLCHLLTGAPPGGQQVRASIPKAVGLVVDRALAPSPDRRYRTVAAFADALSDAVKISDRARPALSRHPRLVGAIGASVLAAGIWLGWNRSRAEGNSARTAQEIGKRGREGVGPAPTRSGTLDTARMAQGRTKTGSESGRPLPKKRERPPPPVSKVPADLAPGTTPGAEPVKTGAIPSPNRMPAASKGSLHKAEPGDSEPGVELSPFRRAHPWAANPEGRFYFPSSCPLALRSHELLYFTSETEARATGRSRSTEPGC
jgi:hypothetical protein